MAAYDDLDVKRIFTVGIGSVVVTAVTALAVQVLYYSMSQRERAETSAKSDYKSQRTFLETQAESISVYGVDETNGNYVIPVEDAFQAISKQTAHSGDHAKDDSSDET